jgi:DNA polymerase III subunit epsilon
LFHRFQNLKLNRKAVVLALDASSTDPMVARLVRIASMTIDPAAPPANVFATHINPGMPISLAARVRHGITDDDVKHAPLFPSMAQEFYDILDGAAIIGYGIREFALPLLAEEFARAGFAFPLEGLPVLDVFQVVDEIRPRTLATSLRHFCGMALQNRHEPDDDLDAVALVLDGVVAHYAALSADFDELRERFARQDFGGMFRREEGRLVFAFGDYEGCQLPAVADVDPDYLRNLLGYEDCPEDVRRILRITLQNAFCLNPDAMAGMQEPPD